MLAFLQERQNPTSVFLLVRLSRRFDDLQVNLILQHSMYQPWCVPIEVLEQRTWPMRAIVSPAKAPPRSTRPTATNKYIHNVGSSEGIGASSSTKEGYGDHTVEGYACAKGTWAIPTSRSLAAERTSGRTVRYLSVACTLGRAFVNGWEAAMLRLNMLEIEVIKDGH